MTDWKLLIGLVLALCLGAIGFIALIEDNVNWKAIGMMASAMIGTLVVIFGGAALFMRWIGGSLYKGLEALADKHNGTMISNAMGEKQAQIPCKAGHVVVDLRTDADTYTEARTGKIKRWTRFALELPQIGVEAFDVEYERRSAIKGALPAGFKPHTVALLETYPDLRVKAAEGPPATIEIWLRGYVTGKEALSAAWEAVEPSLGQMAAKS